MSVQAVFDAVIAMDEEAVVDRTKEAIAAGTDVSAILNDGLISAMDKVGELFSAGEFFVPEMLMAAEAMKAGLEIVKPNLAENHSNGKGTVVIGTVRGDLHDIGKNLVVMMLESAGFDVVDLGVNVESHAFIEAALAKKADVIALSALLTTTMPSMERAINDFREEGLAAKIIIGGAPVTQDFADRIGADGYSDDAPGAVRLVKKIMAHLAGGDGS